MVVGFYFLFFKEKNLILRLGDPQKKDIILLSLLNFSKVANS